MALIENVWLTYLAMSIGVINVCLMMGLLNSYLKTYQEIKSGFTIGLLYFTSLILIQNIFITLYLAVQILVPPPEMIISELHEPVKPLLVINMIQLVALCVLYSITRK